MINILTRDTDPGFRRGWKPIVIAPLAALALALALAGCAANQATTTAQNSVAALEVSLTAAEQAALVYTSLPRCGQSASPPICSSQSVVDSIKAADNRAFDAVMTAKGAVNNPVLVAAAEAAISLFSSSVPASK